MALLSVIRRWHYRDELSIREIARRTGLSRNTIRKYLRLNGVEPKFQTPDRASKLDPFSDRLTAWLKCKRFLDLTFCLPFISAISVCVDLAGVSRWRLRWSFSRAMA